jgi:hypothetical protein
MIVGWFVCWIGGLVGWWVGGLVGWWIGGLVGLKHNIHLSLYNIFYHFYHFLSLFITTTYVTFVYPCLLVLYQTF